MATSFPIPRHTDRELLSAMGRIRKALSPFLQTNLVVTLPQGQAVTIPDESPDQAAALKYIVDANTEAIQNIKLDSARNNNTVLHVQRRYEETTDYATSTDQWISDTQVETRSRCWVTLLAATRSELKVNDLEASLKGNQDSAWNRYRDAQAQVVNSLQQASEHILVKISERNLQLDKEREGRFAALEKELREQLTQERAKLEREAADQKGRLSEREKAIANRESAFETKEARYVTRQKQQEQMNELKAWLDGWSVTKGTQKKRSSVFWAYVSAIVFTGLLTASMVASNFLLLSSAEAATKFSWWHWVAMGAKTLFPFAAFTTFIVCFIRWSAAWAAQHAEEDFRNRTRLVDIGRASWLLEAVHDAQEHNKEIPPDLLKELSRNLFAYSSAPQVDLHPQVASDLLLQGLSSLRVKTPGGAEIEAKRDGK